MRISELSLPSKGIANAFITGDWHSEHLNKATYKILKDHALSLPPEMRSLIINGDFLDAVHLMKRGDQFTKWFKRADGMDEFFVPVSEEEIAWGNMILDELQTIFKNIIFLFGNHDVRYSWFQTQISPAYAHNFDLVTNLKLNKRGIHFIGYNDWLDWGDNLSITHGAYHGATCHKKHYEASGAKNCIFSHVHHHDVKSFQVRGDTRRSISLPAMCDLNPEYIKNRETNWSNGYGQILMRPDGRFNFFCHEVIDGKLTLPTGRILEG